MQLGDSHVGWRVAQGEQRLHRTLSLESLLRSVSDQSLTSRGDFFKPRSGGCLQISASTAGLMNARMAEAEKAKGNAASSSPQRWARRRRRTLPTCRRAGARALGQDGRRGARGGANSLCITPRAYRAGRVAVRAPRKRISPCDRDRCSSARSGGWLLFSFLAVLEHRDATSYVLQPSFGFFPSRPARDPTPNTKHR